MDEEDSVQPHFVLVHGIGHGAWCWYKIRCLLRKSGCKVSCIDLAGAGINRADPDSILSFEEYNKPLVDFFLALPENEKVILVGHSAGGLSLTHAIHEFGNKIAVAVYVGATMLRSGFCSEQDVQDGAPQLSEVYELAYSLGPENPPTSAVVRPEFQRELLYHLTPIEARKNLGSENLVGRIYTPLNEIPHLDSTLASMLLRPGPALALQRAQFEGGKDIDGVKRVYIKTTYDRAIKPTQQEAMIKRWPPSEVLALESDHSPFFSTPSQLISLLLRASGSAHCC